jgi:hypothetical protein
MSLYLWELRRREAATATPDLPQHVTAPSAGTSEKITLVVAYDDAGELRSRSVSIRASSNPQQRAEDVLRQLLEIYQQKNSPHPLAPSAEIRDVYLVGPNTAVVDINSAFVEGQTSGILTEELTLVSIVQTLSANLPNLQRIKLLVDGKERETLAGHVDLLEVYSVADMSQLASQLAAR